MNIISVTFSIIAILILLKLLYTLRDVYKVSSDKEISAREAMNMIERDPSTISHAYFYDHNGPWVNADGYEVPMTSIDMYNVKRS